MKRTIGTSQASKQHHFHSRDVSIREEERLARQSTSFHLPTQEESNVSTLSISPLVRFLKKYFHGSLENYELWKKQYLTRRDGVYDER